MKKHDKSSLIQIGEELFKTQGYHNTGTKSILEKAQFPRSSFYYIFESKEGFAAEVLENYGTKSAQMYQSILANKQIGTPLNRLVFFASKMTEIASMKKFKSECLVQKFSVECAALNDDLRNSTKVQLNKILNVIEACILEGQKIQEIRKDIRAVELAELYHAQLYGSSILARLNDDGKIINNNLNMILDYMKH